MNNHDQIKISDTRIDYIQIDAYARQLRAEAMSQATQDFIKWIKSFRFARLVRFAH